MPNLYTFGLLALVTWRLAWFIYHDDAPLALMYRLREWLITYHPGRGGLGEGVQCIYCVSLWSALFVMAAWFIWSHTPLNLLAFAVLTGALSAAALLINRVING